jgi:hypothetical protein
MSDFASIRFQPQRPLLRELSADRLNTILQEIRRNKPKGERGITVRQDGNGTYIGLAAALPRGGGGSTAPSTAQPWDLMVTIDSESEADPKPWLVSVRPGTLNGILPSNWNIQQPVEADDEDLYYAKAVIATDGQDITGVTIEIDTTAPEIATATLFSVPSSIDYLFGLYQSGQVYRVIGDGHIVLSPQVWLTVERGGALPGELPYELYYNVLS